MGGPKKKKSKSKSAYNEHVFEKQNSTESMRENDADVALETTVSSSPELMGHEKNESADSMLTLDANTADDMDDETNADNTVSSDCIQQLNNDDYNTAVQRFLDFSVTFDAIAGHSLDRRVAKALSVKLGLRHPTLIQSKAIPLLLEGKDVLARARTGSGKTLAYAIPIVHCLLTGKQSFEQCKPLEALVLVPSRELCRQVSSVFFSLCEYCHSVISIGDTSEGVLQLAQRAFPSILIATPKSFLSLESSRSRRQTSDIVNVAFFVVDEADAMMSLGYKKDLEKIVTTIREKLDKRDNGTPRYRTVLCSATFNAEVDYLKSLTLHKPAILKLEDDTIDHNDPLSFSEGHQQLAEYYVTCATKDKYLVLYSLLRLSLLPFKCLIFTESSDTAYSLSFFLERFAIHSAVLCPTLPFSSRLNILESFNQGLLQILIATDEFFEQDTSDMHDDNSDAENSDVDKPKEKSFLNSNLKRRRFKKDSAYGIHRGIDLQGVGCVVNFSIPQTEKTYIHRIGRTARAGASGVALSLCASDKPNEAAQLHKIMTARPTNALSPLALNLSDIECFRYRVEDVLKSVTHKAVVALRAYDLQRQLLKSKKLKEHFETNPEDAEALKQAFKSLQINTSKKHLQQIPQYFNASLNSLAEPTSVQVAIGRLNDGESQDVNSENKKRSSTSRNPFKQFVRNSKRTRVDDLLKKQLAKTVDYSMTAPENLPAISGRKLYTLTKKKSLKRKNKPLFLRRNKKK